VTGSSPRPSSRSCWDRTSASRSDSPRRRATGTHSMLSVTRAYAGSSISRNNAGDPRRTRVRRTWPGIPSSRSSSTCVAERRDRSAVRVASHRCRVSPAGNIRSSWTDASRDEGITNSFGGRPQRSSRLRSAVRRRDGGGPRHETRSVAAQLRLTPPGSPRSRCSRPVSYIIPADGDRSSFKRSRLPVRLRAVVPSSPSARCSARRTAWRKSASILPVPRRVETSPARTPGSCSFRTSASNSPCSLPSDAGGALPFTTSSASARGENR